MRIDDLALQRRVCVAYLEYLEPAVLAEVAEGLNRLQDVEIFWDLSASLPAAASLAH